MSNVKDSGKTYHDKLTGDALKTANNHQDAQDITLFGSWFCPFVQRVWVSAEYLGIDYKYYEVDPYAKPKDLLEVSPKGLVPGLKLHKYTPPRALNESTVILEYFEDLAAASTKRSLLPPVTHPYARSLVRLQCDHVNRTLVPAFYRYLQAQDAETQIKTGKEFNDALYDLTELFERAEREIINAGGAADVGEKKALGVGLGLWHENGDLGLTDVMVAPWIYRASNVLKYYRGFVFPPGAKFEAWMERLLNHPAFKVTCSEEQKYLESYERYAYNRPNTSQVANAINSGRGLP